MNGIVVYAGKGDCRKIISGALCRMRSKGTELSGLAVLRDGGFSPLTVKGPPALLAEKTEGAEAGAGLGLAECSNALRAKPSGVLAPPAANSRFAAVLDREMDNFEELKQWCRGAMPIGCDEDLLLALLSLVNGASVQETVQRALPSLSDEVGFAFVSAEEEIAVARAGSVPFFVGESDDGFLLANEAVPVLTSCRRYFLLDSGELLRMSRDRVTVWDNKGKKIKKAWKASPISEQPQPSVPAQELFYLSHSAKETLRGLITDTVISFAGLKLSKRWLEKIHRVVLTGQGDAFCAALYAAVQLEALADLPCRAIPAGLLQRSATFFDGNTLLIAVTPGGEEDAVYRSLCLAREFEAKTLVFTQNTYSLCGLRSDLTMDCGGYEEARCACVSSLLALSLFAVYAGNLSGVVSDLYSSVAAKLAELLPGKLASAVKNTEEQVAAAERLLHYDMVYMTGGETDFPAALLTAKHCRETLGIHAAALPLPELCSEENEALPFSLAVAFISSREALRAAQHDLYRLKIKGAELLIYTTANLESELSAFENVIAVTESLPVFDSLTCLAAAFKTIGMAEEKLKEESETEKQVG